MFGRRPDGRRVKGIDPVVQITPYLMPMRCDAQVQLKHSADLEKIQEFIHKERKEKKELISHMALIIAAYVRAVSQNPGINRFIMNKQYFARNNCSVAFTLLKDPDNIDAGETVVKIKFDLTDTIYDVRDLLKATISMRDGAPLTEMKLGFKQKIAVGKALDFIRGTDVEKLLKEYHVI